VTGPPAATAAVRVAVRRALADLDPASPVAAAVSGGADSLALAAALAVERPGSAALVVDHGLQEGSARVAARTAEQCRSLGLAAAVLASPPAGSGGVPAGGPEAAARRGRFAALDAAVLERDLAAVLLGHTLDDQAEGVLLGLARGSGSRALAGMAAVRGPYRRPLLGLRRATVRQACVEAGLSPWEDPHNSDDGYARVRVRSALLPALERELGPGAVAGLARTAALLREDADALDALAQAALPSCLEEGGLGGAALAALLPAVRGRVLKRWAESLGRGAVTSAHLAALRALVDDWHGQGPVALPGGVRVRRLEGQLRADRVDPALLPEHAAALLPPALDRGAVLGAVPGATSLPCVADDVPAEIERVLISEEQIAAKVAELAAQVDRDYAGREILLVGVLKGAVMFMADFARAVRTPVSMEFMAVTSYGSSTSSSGVVRILKDLDREIADKHVLVVEDVVDSGLTLSWLLRNMRSRGPASVEVVALLRKPDAAKVNVPVKYVGFDIASDFVVGYGLDYAERYRGLPFVGLLRPEVYEA